MRIRTDIPRPMPMMTDAASKEYFTAWADQRLVIQHCPECGHWQHYPRALCERCGATPLFEEQEPVGEVYTFTVIRQMGVEPFKSEAPFPIAMVELACGVKIMGTVTDCEIEDLQIGMPVEGHAVVIDGIGIPYWRPRGVR
jgi:uncharacterized protein